MGKKDKQVSLFELEGRFLGFLLEDGYKIKYLRLVTVNGEHCIKLSKEARASVGRVLLPGDWIQVWGEKTVKGDQDERLKAYRISVISPRQAQSMPIPEPTTVKPSSPQGTILVCQKSDCMKRGGKAVCQALEATLRERGLTDQVTVKGTGCMKQCKAAPNIVVNPGKARYGKISASEIPAVIDHHFPQPSRVEVERATAIAVADLKVSQLEASKQMVMAEQK